MFLTRPRADAGQDRSVFSNFWFDAVGRLTGAGTRVTVDSAMGLPAVFSCVRVLAESFAIMPFKLYLPSIDGKTRGPQIRKHWLYRLLAKAPNKFQSPYEFRLMLQGHLALRGNAFCQITANGKGEIVDLLPLHPDRMLIEMLPNGSYRYRYTDQTGNVVIYTRGEIWHLRGLSSDGIIGLSPIEVARESIGEGLALQAYSSRFFANDAKPGGGWIEYPGRFADATTKKTFRDSWAEMQAGKNRGKVAVLEGGMKFHELGLNNADSQFIESRASKVSDVARLFRIPPHKIGDLSKATFSNIEQQSIEFWQDTMLPWAEMWESSIEFFLLGPDSDLEPEFDMSRMMRGDGEARGKRINALVLGGVMTPNEGRQEEGLDPKPGGDRLLVPMNMAIRDDDGNVSEPPDKSAGVIPVEDAEDSGSEQPEPGSGGTEARMRALLASNAARMARRIAAGSMPSAEVLADALAIPTQYADTWLSLDLSGFSEIELASSLREMAQKGTP